MFVGSLEIVFHPILQNNFNWNNQNCFCCSKSIYEVESSPMLQLWTKKGNMYHGSPFHCIKRGECSS